MWITTQRTLVGLGGVLALLVYALQFQKACGESTPYQCVTSFVGWMQQGLLAPRQNAGGQPKQENVKAPAPPPQAHPVPAESKAPPSGQPSPGPSVSVAGLIKDRRFTVVNSGSITLLEFFATRCSVDHWGRDLLGKDVIPAGQRYVVNLDDGSGGCCFDLRARFQGGQQRMNMGVDVCSVGTWTVGN